jgi:hypothetical protein
MENTSTTKIAELIRQAKYEGFIRHISVTCDEATTARKFASYVKQDKAREDKYTGLRQAILDGLK